jgi:NAD-dependent deacetylase
MPRRHRIVVLTGAGISAESGISTFRDPDGVWAKFKIEEVATPQAFQANPAKVYDFYNGRRRGLATVKPNAGHLALAQLERDLVSRGSEFLLVTQNVDNLHEAAGSTQLLHMHGQLAQAWCTACDGRTAWADDLSTKTACPQCRKAGQMRPDVVWFGEMPYEMERIYEALMACDLFVSIGTSGNVYPANGFVALANRAGAHTVELNLEPSEGVSHFDAAVHGKASDIVPTFVSLVLKDLV